MIEKTETEIDTSKMNIFEKLTRMQKELLQIPMNKSGKNKFGGFNYYTLDDLLPPITILCEKYGTTLYFNFPVNEQGNSEVGELHLINWNNPEDCLIIQVPFPELEKLPKMNWAQSSGTYQTYLKRYLLLHSFNIIEEEVIDATNPDEFDNSSSKSNNQPLKYSKEKKPPVLQKVIKKCNEDFPDMECDAKLLNKVSMKMLRNNEISNKERKEIFEYLKGK